MRQPAAGDRRDETAQEVVRVLSVDADAGLDRDRHGDGGAHRPHARGHELGLGHQTGAEARVLDPIRGAADVQVDLVVAACGARLGAAAELVRIGAAELQGKRVLRPIEAQEPLGLAEQDRPGRDHLGVEQRARRDQAQEVAAMPIGPVHHRRDGQAAVERIARLRLGWHPRPRRACDRLHIVPATRLRNPAEQRRDWRRSPEAWLITTRRSGGARDLGLETYRIILDGRHIPECTLACARGLPCGGPA